MENFLDSKLGNAQNVIHRKAKVNRPERDTCGICRLSFKVNPQKCDRRTELTKDGGEL